MARIKPGYFAINEWLRSCFKEIRQKQAAMLYNSEKPSILTYRLLVEVSSSITLDTPFEGIILVVSKANSHSSFEMKSVPYELLPSTFTFNVFDFWTLPSPETHAETLKSYQNSRVVQLKCFKTSLICLAFEVFGAHALSRNRNTIQYFED